MSLIIAACALFTAVYDVIQRLNSSNTITLSAASGASFGVEGTTGNGNETHNLNFTQGTYLVLFGGQGGANTDWSYKSKPAGAVCLAFYKGSSMTVEVGVRNGASTNYHAGHGKTIVTTNFALPKGYTGTNQAIAAGAGGADASNYTHDGTFAGWEGTNYSQTKSHTGFSTRSGSGMPATQSHGGYRYDNVITASVAGDSHGTATSSGGAGYYDGGAGYCVDGTSNYYYSGGGGGSCTPWCYPVYSSDADTASAPTYSNASFNWYDSYNKQNRSEVRSGLARHLLNVLGAVYFYRIDPTSLPSADGGALKNTGKTGAYTPVTALQNIPASTGGNVSIDPNMGRYLTNYDCGIRTAWVYSVSENGGVSWHGVGSEDLILFADFPL